MKPYLQVKGDRNEEIKCESEGRRKKHERKNEASITMELEG
jgi:hypothetical protein